MNVDLFAKAFSKLSNSIVDKLLSSRHLHDDISNLELLGGNPVNIRIDYPINNRRGFSASSKRAAKKRRNKR